MRINVCIPTRSKPEYLAEYMAITQDAAALPTTRFIVAADADDVRLPEYEHVCNRPGVHLSVAAREDALGQKFNRCVSEERADIYVMAVDDVAIATRGWDEILANEAALFPDGIVNMQFGVEPHGEYIPGFQAITHRMVELQGDFAAPYFPFWWHNTWAYEIAELAGRRWPVQIAAQYPKVGEFPSAPRRDIGLWAAFFDEMRVVRAAAADRIIEACDNPPWRTAELARARPVLMAMQLQRNALLRDPKFCERLEKDASLPDPLDARHARLRNKAADALSALASTQAKAA